MVRGSEIISSWLVQGKRKALLTGTLCNSSATKSAVDKDTALGGCLGDGGTGGTRSDVSFTNSKALVSNFRVVTLAVLEVRTLTTDLLAL
jgi:hypothetical protein